MKSYCVLAIILLIACKQDNSIDPQSFIPSSSDLNDKFEFEFVSEDTIRIFANESAHFADPFFNSIVLGFKDEDHSFVNLDTVSVKYEITDNRYQIIFSKLCKISNLISSYTFDHIEIILQLHVDQFDYRTISFKVYPHKYPYESATIFLRSIEIPEQHMIFYHFNDFSFAGDNLYFIRTPSHSVFELNLPNKMIREIMQTGAEFCVYHDGYFYLDTHQPPVSKFNATTDSLELEIGDEIINTDYVHGLEIYQNRLYVLHSSDDKEYLSSFEVNGDFIESFPFISGNWGLTIHNDIVYTKHSYRTGEPHQYTYHKVIRRYNLSSHELLPPLLAPSSDMDAIQIYEDKLYYSLYWGFSICYLPLYDLREKI